MLDPVLNFEVDAAVLPEDAAQVFEGWDYC
jgi:hypothetical protein